MPLTGSRERPDEIDEPARRYSRRSNIPEEELGASMNISSEGNPFNQTYTEAQVVSCPTARLTEINEPRRYVKTKTSSVPQITQKTGAIS